MKTLQEKSDNIKVLRDEAEQKLQNLNELKYAEIKIIEDKYKDELGVLEQSLDTLNAARKTIIQEIIQVNITDEWNEAKSTKEINEFYLMSMLKKINIDTYPISEIKHKQTLANDLNIWMIINDSYSPYKLYLAFDKDMLIGTSYRETAKHAGDETTAFSFIGQFDEPLTIENTNDWNSDTYHSNTTFQGWVRELKKLNKNDISPLPMNDETLEHIRAGLQDYWSEYSWDRKTKKHEQKTA